MPHASTCRRRCAACWTFWCSDSPKNRSGISACNRIEKCGSEQARSHRGLIVPTLRVGMPQGTLRVPALERDAERPGLHSHAERGNDQGDRVAGISLALTYAQSSTEGYSFRGQRHEHQNKKIPRDFHHMRGHAHAVWHRGLARRAVATTAP
ncbi:hypothetical protein PFAS1_05310 [Pseudomonas frederiksbergensis]|nr:hypothetical protein PFAS1_05310 [Pseudomonas frederiksbergensis]